jgi:hypothetical protein
MAEDKKPTGIDPSILQGAIAQVLQQSIQKPPEKKQETPPKNRKLEFMQRFVLLLIIFGIGIVTLTLALNFILLWNGKAGMPEETVAAFGTIGAAVMAVAPIAYAGLQGIRGWSDNKHVRGKKAQQEGTDNG